MTRDLLAYLRLLRPYRRYLARIIALEVFGMLFAFLEPVFLLVFMNEVVLKTNLNLLYGLVVAMLATGASYMYIVGVVKYHRARLGQLVIADVRAALFERFLAEPPRFFEEHPPGALVALSTSEVEALDAIHEALFWGVVTALILVLVIAVCFLIAPDLALLLLIPFPVMALLIATDGAMRARGAVVLRHQAALVGFLKQRLSNVVTIQAFGREATEAGRLRSIDARLLEAKGRTDVLAQAVNPIFGMSRTIVIAAVLLVGGIAVIRRDDLSLGAVTAIYAYAGILFKQVNDLFAYIIKGRLALAPLSRILEKIGNAGARAAGPPTRMARATGKIAFENLSFRYAPDAPWAVHDLSFEAEPGQVVAIVGLSGSGKSTLFRLLLRLYDPTMGSVRLDGQDIRTLPLDHVRRQIGLATQDAVVFDASIAENIRYGRADATADEVEAAARTAIAHPFIERLPHGYATPIGEGGAELSGGQKHRIALARVLLKDAPVLLLDEVTAGLDAKTESELQTALSRVMRGRTTIVIAHRLTTIIGADKILVMERGRIVQQGTHKELYREKDGLYRVLFDLQFKGALESLGLARSKEGAAVEAKAVARR